MCECDRHAYDFVFVVETISAAQHTDDWYILNCVVGIIYVSPQRTFNVHVDAPYSMEFVNCAPCCTCKYADFYDVLSYNMFEYDYLFRSIYCGNNSGRIAILRVWLPVGIDFPREHVIHIDDSSQTLREHRVSSQFCLTIHVQLQLRLIFLIRFLLNDQNGLETLAAGA